MIPMADYRDSYVRNRNRTSDRFPGASRRAELGGGSISHRYCAPNATQNLSLNQLS